MARAMVLPTNGRRERTERNRHGEALQVNLKRLVNIQSTTQRHNNQPPKKYHLGLHTSNLKPGFQHTIHKAPDNKCFCRAGKRQDTKHLLLECEEYRMERAAMKKLLKNIPLELNVLFCTSKGHEALAWFLQKTNICTVGWQNEKRGYNQAL